MADVDERWPLEISLTGAAESGEKWVENAPLKKRFFEAEIDFAAAIAFSPRKTQVRLLIRASIDPLRKENCS